ncbi:MAG: hypothetical protein PVJ39_04755 [Gammaproteobacteria bacterium]|jgi:hypothetical protein
MKYRWYPGLTDKTVLVFVRDSSTTDGSGLTGLTYNSSGLTCYYIRPGSAAAQLTLATQTVTGAHSDGGFVEIDSTNMPGWYRLDLSDAIIAAGVGIVGIVLRGATNMADCPIEIQLDIDGNITRVSESATAADNLETATLAYSATRGLAGTALPAAAADSAGGLPISDAGGLDIDTLLAHLNADITSRAAAAALSTVGGNVSTILGRIIGTIAAGTHVAQTGDSFSRIGANGSGLTDLAQAATALSSAIWTNARAGYLDNSNVGGLVASQADVQAITQASRVRISVPAQLERPDSGSVAYRIWIYSYNELHQAEDLDSNPTVTAENNAGVDRSSNLGTVTKPGGTTGQYYVDYTLASGAAIEGLVFKVNATEGGSTTQYPASTMVVDTTAVDFTATDRANLLSILQDTGTDIPAQIDSLNDLSAAEAQSAAAAALNAYDPPTNTEMEARTKPAASYFDPSTDEVTTDAASQEASKADVSGLSTFDPETDILENSKSYADIFRIAKAVLAGKSNTNGTVFRDDADSKARATFTIDEDKNRINVVLDGE